MNKLTSSEIRQRFIDFFVKNGHKNIQGSPLVLENHPTLLFVNSGMVQLTPYFLGEKDPIKDFGSNMLVDTQKSIRTGDLDIIGKSKYHHTFFEMLGSWSIGAYNKQKAVELAFDLLTNTKYGFGLDPSKFIPTVFGGSHELGEDKETIKAWKSVGIKNISKLPASENWWSPGGLTGPGPCGPCTEVLYDRGEEFGKKEETPGLTDNPRYLEIWNAGVFMSYNRKVEGGKLYELATKSVDTGAGLERITALLQNANDNYETDLFKPIINKIIELSDNKENVKQKYNEKNLNEIKEAIRRSADHLKAASFLIVENIYPSNKDQGYVLRRLIRTAFNDFVWKIGIDSRSLVEVVPTIIQIYKDVFPEIDNYKKIKEVIEHEGKSYESLANNVRKVIIKKYDTVVTNPYDLRQSHGASWELVESIAKEQNKQVNQREWEKGEEEHQKLSKEKSALKFKGGLAGTSEKEVKLHTATHILHQALREELGKEVQQQGSNINPTRLRFDFSYNKRVTSEQLKEIENKVNNVIKQGLPVKKIVMDKEEAEKTGALHFFKEKYGDKVNIYYIGESLKNAYSKEYCGGPHVKNTKKIGKFKILKEEGVAKGVRRIRATVES